MAKKKTSLKISIISGIFCLIVGLIVGFIGNIIFSLPDSYKIPDSVQGSSYVSSGQIDKSVISSNDLSIHFLELGNKNTGDCIFISAGDTQILVDGGSKTNSVPHITKYVDEYMTDDVLDFVIVTHAHEDHYAGFATNKETESLFDHYTEGEKSIGTIIDFPLTNKENNTTGMYANYLREKGEAVASGAKAFNALECIQNSSAGAQRTYDLTDDIELNILYQKYYETYSKTENNYSVCFEIKQGTKSYLFTGDLEEDGEKSLIAPESNNNLGKVELYKAGHHGSKTSSSPELLKVIQPKIVVVTCVAGSSEYTNKNENQFPTQAFINNVSIYTKQIYVTSYCEDYNANKFSSFNGTVVVCSKNSSNTTSVYCSNNTTILKETDWFKNNRTLPANAVA